jgi:HEAT repeat protein
VRVSAAVALGNLGGEAKDAAGPLSGLLKDENAQLRSAAGEAVRKITGPSPKKD